MRNPLLDKLSSPEARGKRIRFLRDHLLSLTRREFCAHTDITQPALKGWELGWGGGLTPQGAEKIVNRARELNIFCSVTWLLHGIGKEATFITKELFIQEEDENHIAKELLLFRELNNSIDAIMRDDGMIPLLFPGNYVGGIIVSDIQKAIDRECIIVDENNDIFIRILKNGDNLNHFNLHCLNEHTITVNKEIKNVKIKIAAPIIWIRRINRRL
ncbi:hypothetical protein [Legionella clemsonensis]|nr:hypothetical protein [Legionella clemsonensis]